MHTETAKKIYASEATAKGIATKLTKATSQAYVVRKRTTGWAVVLEGFAAVADVPAYTLVEPNGATEAPPAAASPSPKAQVGNKPIKPKTGATGTIKATLHQITNAYVGIKTAGGGLLWIGKSNIVGEHSIEDGKITLTMPMAFIKKRKLEELLVGGTLGA